MGPVARQVDYHQEIKSILCCAYITTITVIFIRAKESQPIRAKSTYTLFAVSKATMFDLAWLWLALSGTVISRIDQVIVASTCTLKVNPQFRLRLP
jgi:hypothetical protein